ncbi:type I restriction enzyme subunit R domain-containing protein [Aggregatibacter actinomycetemcomitans]
MLLTGFDAPRLKKLYLGRLIKAHNLLQTLTRVQTLPLRLRRRFRRHTKRIRQNQPRLLGRTNQRTGRRNRQLQPTFQNRRRNRTGNRRHQSRPL